MNPKSDKLFGAWIVKINRAMNNIHDHKLHKYDLTLSQVTVLFQLWCKDGQTQKEIQEKLNLRPASVSGLVDVLVEKKLIIREHDHEDARLKRLFLTDEGRKLEDLSTKIIDEIEDVMSKGFSEDEKAIFLCWMKKLYNNLNE